MSNNEQRDELAAIYVDTLNRGHGMIDRPKQGVRAADAIIAAGYAKVDHVEYAASHKHAGLEVADEDGDLFTERGYFEDYFDEYGNATLMQRAVGPWMPLEPEAEATP